MKRAATTEQRTKNEKGQKRIKSKTKCITIMFASAIIWFPLFSALRQFFRVCLPIPFVSYYAMAALTIFNLVFFFLNITTSYTKRGKKLSSVRYRFVSTASSFLFVHLPMLRLLLLLLVFCVCPVLF